MNVESPQFKKDTATFGLRFKAFEMTVRAGQKLQKMKA
jgi:hypothetical protein